MTDNTMLVELNDTEIDAVSGGRPLVAGGLVNVVLSDVNVEVLNDSLNDLTININDNIRNIANNNDISVGALIQVLGGPGAILQRQTRA